MNEVIKEKWCLALRSGNYTQGFGKLHDKNNTFCCLGVLCDIYLKENGKEWFEIEDRFVIFEEWAYLPTLVKEWAELDVSNPGNVATLNDDFTSFVDIADIIEKRL